MRVIIVFCLTVDIWDNNPSKQYNKLKNKLFNTSILIYISMQC